LNVWHGLCTCLGLVLPVRWVAFVPFCGALVAITSFYAVFHGCTRADVSLASNLLIAVLNTLVMMISKFTQERAQRRCFQMAYLVQDNVCVVKGQQRLPPPETIGSKRDKGTILETADNPVSTISNPETSEVGHMFEEINNVQSQRSLQEQLEKLVEVGRQQKWLVESKELNVDSSHVLGAGAFGMVLGGVLCNTPVAVKVSRGSQLSSVTPSLTDLSNELRVLRSLHHPNIVMLTGACLEPSVCEIAVVLEMVSGYDLALSFGNTKHHLQILSASHF